MASQQVNLHSDLDDGGHGSACLCCHVPFNEKLCSILEPRMLLLVEIIGKRMGLNISAERETSSSPRPSDFKGPVTTDRTNDGG